MGLENDIDKSIEAAKKNNSEVSMLDIEGLSSCVKISNDLPFGINYKLF